MGAGAPPKPPANGGGDGPVVVEDLQDTQQLVVDLHCHQQLVVVVEDIHDHQQLVVVVVVVEEVDLHGHQQHVLLVVVVVVEEENLHDHYQLLVHNHPYSYKTRNEVAIAVL